MVLQKPWQIGDLRVVLILRTVVCSVGSTSRVSFGNCTNAFYVGPSILRRRAGKSGLGETTRYTGFI